MQRSIGGKDGAHVPPNRDRDWISSSSVVSSFKLREPSPSASALENSELNVVVLLLVEPLLDEETELVPLVVLSVGDGGGGGGP